MTGTATTKEEMVLLVEDDEATAELETRALARAGLRVRAVTRGSEAVVLLRKESFLAVILDYQLPDGDPWPVVEAANAKVPRIPVIIVTGMGTEQAAAEAVHRGVAEYVRKAATFQDQLPDIIDRVSRLARAEHKLRQSDALFQLIAEHMSDLILITGLDGNIKYCSASCKTLFGYEPEEITGVQDLEFVHPEDRENLASLLARLPIDGHFTATYRRRRKDGSYAWVEATTNALRNPLTGWIMDMVAIVRDTTERLSAEETFRGLLESAPDAMVIVGPEGKVVLVNSQTERMFGYTRDELLGRTVEVLLPTLFRDSHKEHRRAYFVEPHTRPMGAGLEQYGLRKDGTEFPVEVGLSPLQTAKEILVTAAIRDISERKQAEQAMRASLREKELLLKEIHHRVKNNLQVVSSLLSLQVRHVLDSETQEMFRECQRRVRSIALVHEQMYKANDLSHISLRQYIEALVAGLFHTFQASEGNIRHEIDIGDVAVGIDTAIPCGLLINELVTNSLKHAFPDGRTGMIRIALTQEEGRPLKLVVSDNGIGLPESIHLQNTSSLGLELVCALARQLQLRTVVDVRRNGGTAFEFKFHRD